MSARRPLRATALALLLAIAPVAAAPAGADPAPAGAGATADAPDTPVRTPGLDEILTPHVGEQFRHGRFATPAEFAGPLIRGHDPDFYLEPDPVPDLAPGTVLKAAPVQVQFLAFRPGRLRAWRLMYATREMDGAPALGTGILMIPEDGRPDAARPLVAYQEANDSVGAWCHPSAQWTGSDPLDGSSWSALGPFAQLFSRGFAVMVSDVGNNAESPYGVFAGKYAANTMLDGARAALTVDAAGLAPDAPVGLFGVAGGGVGAGFAAERAAAYAPELDIRATVLEGMAVDQRAFIATADGSIGAGFAFATLLGLEPKYPEMDLDRRLTPLGRAAAGVYRTQCQTPGYFTMPFVELRTLFRSGIPPAEEPAFQHVFADNVLGVGAAPRSAVLISSCAADDSFMSLVPAADARRLAETYRAGGAEVSYQPSDCATGRMVTDLYGWGTDLFGMQTMDWLAAHLGR